MILKRRQVFESSTELIKSMEVRLVEIGQDWASVLLPSSPDASDS